MFLMYGLLKELNNRGLWIWDGLVVGLIAVLVSIEKYPRAIGKM
jgi:hypothetical protein